MARAQEAVPRDGLAAVGQVRAHGVRLPGSGTNRDGAFVKSRVVSPTVFSPRLPAAGPGPQPRGKPLTPGPDAGTQRAQGRGATPSLRAPPGSLSLLLEQRAKECVC